MTQNANSIRIQYFYITATTFRVIGVIFSLFTPSGRKSRRESRTISFTIWNSNSPFKSAQNIRSRSFQPRPLSSCRTWLAAEPFRRTSRTCIRFSSMRLRTTLTMSRGFTSRVGKLHRPWMGMDPVRMVSRRCTCSQLSTPRLMRSPSAQLSAAADSTVSSMLRRGSQKDAKDETFD